MKKIRVPYQDFYHSRVYDQLLSVRSPINNYTAINNHTLHVSILKNAHNWAVARFGYLKQQITVRDPNYLVLVREPIGRWISGISTYCRAWNILDQDYDNFLITQHTDYDHIFAKLDQLLSRTLVLDAHTVPQQHYIKDLDSSRVTLVSIHNNLEQTIDQLYDLTPYTVSVEKHNATLGNSAAEFRENILQQYMHSRDLTAQLHRIYSRDSELLAQVCNPS